MKGTNYCFIFPIEGKNIAEGENFLLIYNSLTNALATIEKDKYEQYETYCRTGQPIEDKTFIEQLEQGGFLIPDDYNELNEIRYRLYSSRFSDAAFGLTLAPTSDCNFRCSYCYEKDVLRTSYMTQEVMDGIVALLEERAENIKDFSVTWYGGEPLLAMDIVESLSVRFMDICREHHIRYSAGIITNGYLLNRDIVQKLNRLSVNFYQITIDGTKETHNRRRPLADGGATYDVILSNILECADILPYVSLRVNVDKTNIASARHLLDFVKEHNLQEKVVPYLGKATNDINSPELGAVCFNNPEFAMKELEYTMALDEKGNWQDRYPQIKGAYCGADNAGGYVIDSDGSMYKCWNDIGHPDYRIGSVVPGRNINHKVYDRYMLFDPTQDPVCSKCRLLPICMGGCPHYRISGHKEEQCSIYKYALDKYLIYAAEQITKERQEK